MAPIQLREFSLAADYAAVLALWQAAAPGVHVGRSDTPAELAKKLARDPDLFLVAVSDGQVIGTVLGGFDGRRGMVYHLAVDARFRQQGVATALMAELEARLKAHGCHKCYLFVTPENTGVVEFYQRLGWEIMPVLPLGKELD